MMEQDQFNAVLPIISADLVRAIVDRRGISEDDAIRLLYDSQLYATLEREETKVWQYSTPMLYSLLEQEWNDGVIHYPDV